VVNAAGEFVVEHGADHGQLLGGPSAMRPEQAEAVPKALGQSAFGLLGFGPALNAEEPRASDTCRVMMTRCAGRAAIQAGCLKPQDGQATGSDTARLALTCSMLLRRVTQTQSGFRVWVFLTPPAGPTNTSNWKPLSRIGGRC
jgi:hypothetical protein